MTSRDKPTISIGEIWPQERDYISRPDRYKYVRRLVKNETCVFCDAREMGPGFESLCLYKGKEAMVILNKYPYNTGHLLVIPLRHCGELSDLTESEFLGVNQLLRTSVEILKKEYACAGLNIGMNHGKVAGAGIPDHLHWHIIPRWFGDTNFFPLIAETKVHPETLEQCFERLKPHFANI